jgi:hypothetical protein
MTEQNVTFLTSHNQLFNLHYINITTILTISVHFEIRPLNTTLAYLFIYKFDQIPQLNQSDGWTLFCPINLTDIRSSINYIWFKRIKFNRNNSFLFKYFDYESTYYK